MHFSASLRLPRLLTAAALLSLVACSDEGGSDDEIGDTTGTSGSDATDSGTGATGSDTDTGGSETTTETGGSETSGTSDTSGSETTDGTSESETTDGTSDTGGPLCGDGDIDPGEECDLGPDNADDGTCTSSCTVAVCGDGLVYAGEEACDDGDEVPDNYCDNSCELTGTQLLWDEAIAEGGESKSGRGIAIDSLGNAVVVGYRGPLYAEYLWVRKYGSAGELLWDQEYAESSKGEGVAVGLDDVIWAVGRSTDGDFLVLRYDAGGELLSSEAADFEGELDRAWAVATDDAGRAYVSGMAQDGVTLNERLALRAYDVDAQLLFSLSEPVAFAGDGIGIDIAEGGELVVGGLWNMVGDQDLWLGRFSSEGEPLWSYNEGSDLAWDTVFDVAVHDDGSIYATGAIDGGPTDIWIRKHTPDGEEIWTVTHSSAGMVSDRGYGVAIDSVGDLVVAGVEDGAAWIRKLDADGVELWTEVVPDADWAEARDVAIDAEDRIWVTGQRYGDQIWVAKLMP